MGSQLIILLLSKIRFYNNILLFQFEYIIKEIKEDKEKIVLHKNILDDCFFLVTICTHHAFCIAFIKFALSIVKIKF